MRKVATVCSVTALTMLGLAAPAMAAPQNGNAPAVACNKSGPQTDPLGNTWIVYNNCQSYYANVQWFDSNNILRSKCIPSHTTGLVAPAWDVKGDASEQGVC